MEDSQYLLLTTCPSLAFISLHDSAGSSGMEPRGTEETNKTFKQNKTHRTSTISMSHLILSVYLYSWVVGNNICLDQE